MCVLICLILIENLAQLLYALSGKLFPDNNKGDIHETIAQKQQNIDNFKLENAAPVPQYYANNRRRLKIYHNDKREDELV